MARKPDEADWSIITKEGTEEIEFGPQLSEGEVWEARQSGRLHLLRGPETRIVIHAEQVPGLYDLRRSADGRTLEYLVDGVYAGAPLRRVWLRGHCFDNNPY